MRLFRIALSALLLVVSLAVAPAAAPAADAPPTGPQLIYSYGFEGTGFTKLAAFTPNYGTKWTIGKNPQPPTGIAATYVWGPEPSSRHSGSYGLWCSAYNSGTRYYSFNWATYLEDTSGRAILSLPELADYYSSELQFWYLMPSRGAADGGSFIIGWGPPPPDYETWGDDAYFSLTSQWTKQTYDLTEQLSRQSGEIWWEFNNKLEGGSQYPAQGQGATIDDVAIYGYKYGPVRDVESVATAGGMQLSWSRPYSAAGGTTEDSRELTYRVWRRPAVSETWTEVTATRIADASSRVTYTDSSAVQGVDYVYRIVSYDPGTGTGYGEIVDYAGGMPIVRLELAASATPTTIRAGSSTQFAYHVSNTGDVPISGIELTDFYGAVPGVPSDTLDPGESFDVGRSATPGVSLSNTVDVSGDGQGVLASASAVVEVTVVDPSVSVLAGVDPEQMAAGDTATFTYQVENTGDTTLEGFTVTDAFGAVVAGVPSSLAPGANFLATRETTLGASTDNRVDVAASGAGFAVSAAATASVDVRHPSVSIDAQVSPASIVGGSSATFTYLVTNTGDTSLDSIALTDALGTVTTGVPSSLAVGASFSASRVVTPAASVLNTATVAALGLGMPVGATDTEFLQFREPNPGIEITATVSPGVVATGDSATFTYDVMNTGNVPVDSISLSDAFGALTSGVPASLDPGETFSVSRVAAPTNSVLNAATVSGVAGAVALQDSDSAYLQVTHPAIDVAASVSPVAIASGASATFTYTVSNTGDATLGTLTLTDYVGSITSGVPSSLAPGQSYQVTRVVSPLASLSNAVQVTGVGTGRTVSATGSGSLTVTNPAVQLEAWVDPSAVAQGVSATFTYRVTNTGDTTLGGISVDDSFGSIITGVPATLAAGAHFDVTRSWAPQASMTNEIDVVASATGKTVDDSASVPIVVTNPAATVVATVDKPTSVAGDSLTFTYTVENTGDVGLTGITLTDSFGAVTTGVPASLASGAEPVTITRTVVADDDGPNVVALSASATGHTIHAGDDVSFDVKHPALQLVVTPSLRGVASGTAADYDIVLTNTGDVPLADVQVQAKIGSLTVDNEQVDTIAAGSSQSLLLTPIVSGSAGTVIDLDFSAWGSYGQGTSWEGETARVTREAQAAIVDSRVEGDDRVHTAIDASEQGFEDGSADAVIIATGFDFPDALSAAGLAGAANGPLLLVRGTSVHADVIAEIKRLQPTRAYVVGGESVLSATVLAQLKALEGASGMPSTFRVQPRIAGTNRFGTAQLVAAEVKKLGGNTSTVFLATGLNFPDALAASSLAARMRAPILLTNPTSLPTQTDAALRALQPDRVIICGGTSAVADSVKSQIAGSSAYGNPSVTRVAGTQRYQTAKLLVEWGTGSGASQGNLAPNGVDGVYLATGTDYPDALAGGVLAGLGGAQWRPLMLTPPTSLAGEVKSYISVNGSIGFISGVGGSSVLSDSVLGTARAAIQ